ncbi:MAG: CAP domain-containing protein [Chitinophagales bacterium]|nr:CAP domain-containing protein [Chitinophagales bacterium]MDW8418646.1 CAP domain-containing protein [Chitinophagales bacterium]
MKIFLAVWCLMFITAAQTNVGQWLRLIPGYQQESYFKERVYLEHTWNSFIELKAAHETIDPQHYVYHLLNSALFFATNKWRVRNRFPALAYHRALRDAAAIHTHQMVQYNFFSHVNNLHEPISHPHKRLAVAGLPDVRMGENCDYTYIDLQKPPTYMQLAEKIISDFQRSTGHRRTMSSTVFTHLGIAAEFESLPKGSYHYLKVTQCLATVE